MHTSHQSGILHSLILLVPITPDPIPCTCPGPVLIHKDWFIQYWEKAKIKAMQLGLGKTAYCVLCGSVHSAPIHWIKAYHVIFAPFLVPMKVHCMGVNLSCSLSDSHSHCQCENRDIKLFSFSVMVLFKFYVNKPLGLIYTSRKRFLPNNMFSVFRNAIR